MGSPRAENHAQQLHLRLVQGDPLASTELIEELLEEVVRRLGARARARLVQAPDDDAVVDAATDALLNYTQRPTTYDPNRSNLLTYLTMSAYGDLLNMLSREYRRKRREVALEAVEDSLSGGNNLVEEGRDEIMERYGIATDGDRAALLRRVAREFPDPRDRQLLDLMLDGERKTEAYSVVLGIQDHEYSEQQRIVKRHKDRISKRLQRLGGKLREPEQED